jgi:glycosyltransferase involved in cell wall biosynthesis
VSTPSLSVVIPAYNVERYIGEALESVLSQVPAGAEVLVLDDESTDTTAAVAERFAPRVRVLREPHRGIAGTFNRGMREARGEIIASIDADDRWLPQKLERQLAVMAADPAVDVVFGYLRQFVSPEVDDTQFLVPAEAIPGIQRGVMLMRRSAWDRVGEMDEHLRAGEFVSWYARAKDAGLVEQILRDVVYERRIHGRNTVLTHRDEAHRDYLRIVKATLDRRRASRNQ